MPHVAYRTLDRILYERQQERRRREAAEQLRQLRRAFESSGLSEREFRTRLALERFRQVERRPLPARPALPEAEAARRLYEAAGAPAVPDAGERVRLAQQLGGVPPGQRQFVSSGAPLFLTREVPGMRRAREALARVTTPVGRALGALGGVGLGAFELALSPQPEPPAAARVHLAERAEAGGRIGEAVGAAASAIVPVEVWEVALEFVPGIGVVPGAASALRSALREAGFELTEAGARRFFGSEAGRNFVRRLASEAGFVRLGEEGLELAGAAAPPGGPPQTLAVPPGIEPIRSLERRYEGAVRLELDQAEDALEDIAREAARSGLRLSKSRTPDDEAIIAALDFPGTIDDAVQSLGLTPAQESVARRLRALLDEETAAMQREIPGFTPREHYFPHEFRTRKPPAPLSLRGRAVGAKPGFMRRRRLEGTLLEILDTRPDLDLVSWDPVEIVLRRKYRGVIYRKQRVLLDELKRVGLAKRASDIPAEQRHLWRTPENLVPFQPRPVPGRPDVFTEPWLVPVDVAKRLENHFGRSAFARALPLRALRDLVQSAKFIKTFGGLFQHIDYSLRTLALGTRYRDPAFGGVVVRALARGFVPGLHRRMLRWELRGTDQSARIRRALVQQGLSTEAGLGFIAREFQDFAGEFWLFRLPIVGRVLEALGSRTYRNAHREYLLGSGERIVRHLMDQGATLEEAAARVAQQMNETFSSLPQWQSVFNDPTVRDAMRLLLFSVQENESWLRIPVKQRGFFVALLANTIVLANLINLMATGRPLSRDAYLPWRPDEDSPTRITFNTRFLRPEIGVGPQGRKLYLDLLGQADTPMRLLLNPAFALQSRLGQLPSAAVQQLQSRTFFGGERLETPRERLEFVGKEFGLPIAVAALGQEAEAIGASGVAAQAAGVNISAEPRAVARNRVGREETGVPYDEMTRQQKLDFRKRHPELFAEVEDLPEGSPLRRANELDREREQRMSKLGEQLRAGEITRAEYREQRERIWSEYILRREELGLEPSEPKTLEERALAIRADWFRRAREESPAGVITQLGDVEEAARAEVERQLGKEGVRALDDALMASADPVEREFLRDRRAIRESGYWDAADVVIRALGRRRGWSFRTYSEFEEALRREAQRRGVRAEDTPIYREVQRLITTGRINFRRRRPDIDALLVIWGYAQTPRTEEAAAIAGERLGLALPVASR